MKKLFITAMLLVATSGIASASESAHSLLNELIQPHLGGDRNLHAGLQQESSAHLPLSAGKDPDGLQSMFTLEELNENRNSSSAALDLPDDQPAAEIPLALNDKVEYFINFFQTKGRTTYARWLSRSTRYLPMMHEILRKEGLPDNLVYVAMIESGFQLHARSVASAVGPWQFISSTGRRYALRIDQWVDERKDPVKATMAAAMYLKDLYGMFNNDWYLAAAGYNAGENKIFRAINMYDTNDFWELSKGSYLKRETKEYVPKLLAAAIIAKDPEKYGFSEVASVPIVEYDTVTVKGRTDLELVARLTGTTYQTIKELNPALRHWCTPPNYPDYELHIPKGSKERFEKELASVPEDKRFTDKPLYTRYTAGRKDSLAAIAKRTGISVQELADLNSIGKKDRIAGKSLIIPVKQTTDFAREGRSEKHEAVARYYTTRKGDTLASIAKRFKVSARLLVAWNNLKGNTMALIPGKRIIIAKSGSRNQASKV